MVHVVAQPVTSHRPQLFSPHEQEYLAGMKRKDRSELVEMVQPNRRRAVAAPMPLRLQVLRSTLPDALKLQLFDDMKSCGGDKHTQWVKRLLRLPLGVVTARPRVAVGAAIKHARDLMDRGATGHVETKREVLKLVCQAAAQGGGATASYALGLEGAPGTGKTHFVTHCLAAALGRPLVSVPLGGASDLSYLMGSIYTYEGSKEGRLAAALMEAKCMDPIVYFDEVDKISPTDKGSEIVSTLIHLIDPSANTALRDRYFHGVDLDFSKCTFVFSYNDASKVHPVLLDRIRRVAVPTPTMSERVEIVQQHLVPRIQRRLNAPLAPSRETVEYILERCSQGGMRAAEKTLDHVLATAQLYASCPLTEQVEVLGKRMETVFDESDGGVCVAFAREVVTDVVDEREQRDVKQMSMYL